MKKKSTKNQEFYINFQKEFIKQLTKKLNTTDPEKFSALSNKDIYVVIIFFMEIIIPVIAVTIAILKHRESPSESKWKIHDYRTFKFSTLCGTMEFRLPTNLRGKLIKPEFCKRTKNMCKNLTKVATLLYANGLSFIEISRILNHTSNRNFSKSTICEIVKPQLDKEVIQFQNSEINCATDKMVFLSCDVTYLPVKSGDKYKKIALYVVVGQRLSGRREVLSLDFDYTENHEKWTNIFNCLLSKGMNIPTIIARDGASASFIAIKHVFGDVKIQTCLFHVLSNIRKLADTREGARKMVRDFSKAIHISDDELRTSEIENLISEKYNEYAEDLKGILSDEQIFTFHTFDKQMHEIISTSNLSESVNQKIKIIISHHKQFPSVDSALRAIIMRIKAINNSYLTQHATRGKKCYTGPDKSFNDKLNAFDSEIYSLKLTQRLKGIVQKVFPVLYKKGMGKFKKKWLSEDMYSTLLELLNS